jgi:hypothetical protein
MSEKNTNNRIDSQKLADFLCGKTRTQIDQKIFLTEYRAKNLLIKLGWDFNYADAEIKSILLEEESKFNFEGVQSNRIDFLFEEVFRSTYYFNSSFSYYDLDEIRNEVLEYFNNSVFKNRWQVDLYGKIHKSKVNIVGNILVELGFDGEDEIGFIINTLSAKRDSLDAKLKQNKNLFNKIDNLENNQNEVKPKDPTIIINNIKADLQKIKESTDWNKLKSPNTSS